MKIKTIFKLLALSLFVFDLLILAGCSCYPTGCSPHPYISRPEGYHHCTHWVKRCYWQKNCVRWVPGENHGPYYHHELYRPGIDESNYCPRSQSLPVCEWTCEEPH